MKSKVPASAGIISVVIAVVVIVVIYALCGTVDLVVMKDGKEVSRQEDVSMVSNIDLPEGELTYGSENQPLDNLADLKVEIGVTVVTNLVSFKWQESDNVIIITQN